ncbi:LysR family transcriptional regulator [Clostridium sp. AF27-2AA]|uniref:LysR family transcriptional regulator n=1 Tax=Clostridium sp. AF27-2AA TaxID=2292206 RepID=UPI0015F9F441|nr:LysR family transcriptional regulator [Clostridium sp. AF27-2AA]
MRLKDEKYVCALANYGTIREASEKLYISAPALSMYINHLEKELGVDLFYRNQQRFFPTDIGKKYLERCQKILEIDQEFSIQLGKLQSKKENSISIGMYKRSAAYLWIPLRESLKANFPDLECHLTVDKTERLREMLNKGELDMILLTIPNKPKLQQIFVGKDELLFACPTVWNLENTDLGNGRFPLTDLTKIPEEKIFLPGKTQNIYSFVIQFMNVNNIDYSHFSTLNNLEISMQNVSAGIGCCFTFRSYLNTFPSLSNITFYSLSETPTRINWYLECLDHVMESRYFHTIKKEIARLLHISQISTAIPKI